MLDIGNATFGHFGVERIDRLDIRVVQPRSEHAHATKLAAIFMWDDVVRIIRTRSFQYERTDRFSGDPAACHGAITTLAIARLMQKPLVDLPCGQEMFL